MNKDDHLFSGNFDAAIGNKAVASGGYLNGPSGECSHVFAAGAAKVPAGGGTAGCIDAVIAGVNLDTAVFNGDGSDFNPSIAPENHNISPCNNIAVPVNSVITGRNHKGARVQRNSALECTASSAQLSAKLPPVMRMLPWHLMSLQLSDVPAAGIFGCRDRGAFSADRPEMNGSENASSRGRQALRPIWRHHLRGSLRQAAICVIRRQHVVRRYLISGESRLIIKITVSGSVCGAPVCQNCEVTAMNVETGLRLNAVIAGCNTEGAVINDDPAVGRIAFLIRLNASLPAAVRKMPVPMDTESLPFSALLGALAVKLPFTIKIILGPDTVVMIAHHGQTSGSVAGKIFGGIDGSVERLIGSIAIHSSICHEGFRIFRQRQNDLVRALHMNGRPIRICSRDIIEDELHIVPRPGFDRSAIIQCTGEYETSGTVTAEPSVVTAAEQLYHSG